MQKDPARKESTESMTLLERAKLMRSNQTEAEQRLWYHLRAHRFMDLKFKRQKPIGHYIVEFVCFEPKLVIEIYGGQHLEQADYDARRDSYLREQGFCVLRFWNNQVLGETDAVLESIRQMVNTL
jgi:very-short-patch-repair endonuclease